jgi:hypothetical protein
LGVEAPRGAVELEMICSVMAVVVPVPAGAAGGVARVGA